MFIVVHYLFAYASFGPGLFTYQAFACYDLLDNGKQTLDEYGTWTGDTSVTKSCSSALSLIIRLSSFGLDAKALGQTHLNLSINLIGGPPYQSGALFSFTNEPEQVNIRVGVSFVSADQACQNAETEVGNSSFEDIMNQSKALWQDKLSRVELDIANTPPNVTEMFYSSLYRSFLTPVHMRLSFFVTKMTLICIHLHRITRLEKDKGRSQIRLRCILTPCIAGERLISNIS